MPRLFNMLYGVAALVMLSYGCQCRFITIDDMNMTEEKFYSVFETKAPRGSINTEYPLLNIWDRFIANGQYRIPYTLSGIRDETRIKISQAFDNFTHGSLCFKFVEKTYESEYINFTSDSRGCWSHVGRVDPFYQQINRINLQDPGCNHTGIIIHEIVHALGFFHEHQRPDRDDYVRINENNILPGTESNFLKLSTDVVNSRSTSYDFRSIMHYHPLSFGINGSTTIQFANGSEIPSTFYQRSGLTELDQEQLRLLYPCPATTSASAATCSTTALNAVGILIVTAFISLRTG